MFRKNKSFFLLLIIIFTYNLLPLQAQFTSRRFDVYSDLPHSVSKIEEVYSENFNGDTRWPLFNRDKKKASIKNDRYVLENYRKKGKLTVEKKLPFDHSRDHEIEFTIGMSSDSKKKSYPIIQWWAGKNQSYAMYLDFPKKEVDIYYFPHYGKKKRTRFKLDGDKYSKKVKSLNIGTHALVTIRKFEDTVYLFINKKFIAKVPYNECEGNELKFNVYEDSLVEIDNLSVKVFTPLRKFWEE